MCLVIFNYYSFVIQYSVCRVFLGVVVDFGVVAPLPASSPRLKAAVPAKGNCLKNRLEIHFERVNNVTNGFVIG